MASDLYDHTTYPSQGAAGSSAALRAELDLIEAGFNKFVGGDLAGNASKVLAVNSGGTAVEGLSTIGTGDIVRATSPTLVTPALGVATATSINKNIFTAPATSCTWTLVDGKTYTCSNTLTLAGTDGSTLNVGAGGTLGTAAYTAASAYATLSFTTIAVSGQSNIVADSTGDTLTVAAGTGISLTTDASTDTLTITATSGALGSSYFDKGNSGTTPQVVDFSVAESQKITVTGAFTLSTDGWVADRYCGMSVLLVNPGTNVTFSGITWIKVDGTKTTTFSDLALTLQVSGTEQIIFWRNGSDSTTYGKVIR